MDEECQRRDACNVEECQHEAVRWVTYYSRTFEVWLRLQFCEQHFNPENRIANYEVVLE